MIDFRFGRVDVLGKFLVLRAEHTSAEGNHFARKRVNGKHDTSPKAVTQAVIVRFVTKPCLDKIFFLESLLDGFLGHGIVTFGAIA